MAEPEFRTDAVLFGPVPDREFALAVEAMNPHIVAHRPIAIFTEEVLKLVGRGLVLGKVFQATFSFIPLRVGLDEPLPLRVRLPR